MVILLKTTSVRVSSIQIMQVRVQNKGKSVWKSRYDGDVSQVRTWVGVREMVCAKPRQCVDDISNKKHNICNVCETESWIYHI